jgi:hypothetical protein
MYTYTSLHDAARGIPPYIHMYMHTHLHTCTGEPLFQVPEPLRELLSADAARGIPPLAVAEEVGSGPEGVRGLGRRIHLGRVNQIRL